MSFSAGWLVMMYLALGPAETPENGHIQWRFTSIEQSGSKSKLLFTATIDRGWHLYSQSLDPDGPMPTEFAFDSSEGYRLIGKASETGDVKKSYDSTFMTNVAWYEGQVVFVQRVKARSKTQVTGEIRYSVCSEEVCIPGTVRFTLTVDR